MVCQTLPVVDTEVDKLIDQLFGLYVFDATAV